LQHREGSCQHILRFANDGAMQAEMPGDEQQLPVRTPLALKRRSEAMTATPPPRMPKQHGASLQLAPPAAMDSEPAGADGLDGLPSSGSMQLSVPNSNTHKPEWKAFTRLMANPKKISPAMSEAPRPRACLLRVQQCVLLLR
jgi:hypothetical protein